MKGSLKKYIFQHLALLTIVLRLKDLGAGKVVALHITGDPSEVLDTVSGSSENILRK